MCVVLYIHKYIYIYCQCCWLYITIIENKHIGICFMIYVLLFYELLLLLLQRDINMLHIKMILEATVNYYYIIITT